MRNRMYGGVRGRKTKVGEKLLRFPPTRLYIFLDPLKYIQFRFLRTWFIPKRVYQNNAAVILHLIKYIVTT